MNIGSYFIVLNVERGSLLNLMKIILMMSKVIQNTLYHCFRLSPELIICIGVVYLGLHLS